MSSNDPTMVRGFAWFVFPDPARGTVPGGDRPFETTPHPAHMWWIEGTENGIRNPIWGDTFLFVSDTPEPPRVDRGWTIEPADLGDEFQTDDGLLRLSRLIGIRRTPWGIVQECEFALNVRDMSASGSALPLPHPVFVPGRDLPPGPFVGRQDWQSG
ncbi:MAG TPA: hypothetical protein VGZ22_24510 [Isosphaeraceae bacterium]|jgi:hypothetical protein|nr:hypothetical protein [Isosphaeraceae bacterium]